MFLVLDPDPSRASLYGAVAFRVMLIPRSRRIVRRRQDFNGLVLENRGCRQRGHQANPGRPFVGRELAGGVDHQVRHAHARTRSRLDKCDHVLDAVDGPANDGRLQNGLMRIQNRLDLGRIDVESGADDHFLGAPDDVEAVRLEFRQIAGIEPSFAADRCRKPSSARRCTPRGFAAATTPRSDRCRFRVVPQASLLSSDCFRLFSWKLCSVIGLGMRGDCVSALTIGSLHRSDTGRRWRRREDVTRHPFRPHFASGQKHYIRNAARPPSSDRGSTLSFPRVSG